MLRTFGAKITIPLVTLTVIIVCYILFIWCPVSVSDALKHVEKYHHKTLDMLAHKLSFATSHDELMVLTRHNLSESFKLNASEWGYLKLVSQNQKEIYRIGLTGVPNMPDDSHAILTRGVVIDGTKYTLEILYDYTDLRAEVESNAAQLAIRIFITFFVFALILWGMTQILIVRPIQNLGIAALAMSKGDYKSPVSMKGGAEVSLLSKQFVFMRNRVQQSNEIKDNFISTVSHELRTPLTSIHGSLGLLRSNVVGALPEKLRKIIDVAYRNSERLTILVNDILDAEKLDKTTLGFKFKASSIQSLVDDAVLLNQPYADQFAVLIETKEIYDIQVKVDRDRIHQVLANILSNAIKCSVPGEKVCVSSYVQNDKYVRIAIKDNGPGMTKDVQDRLFEKFFNKNTEELQDVPGTGLGLYISKKIIGHHGGNISFETKHGKGTIFFIDLPIDE